MSVTTRVLTGTALAEALDDVARLRITVFRDFPYLYGGTLDYERDYLRAYLSPGAVVVVAVDDGRIVGAATGAPMADHAADFAAAFADRPEPLDQIFYCAESVLLPDYRGQGLGHAFFDAREAHARALGARWSAFCSVIRPADHPARPADYRPLDGFWRRRGYRPLPGVVAHFVWRDLDQPSDTTKDLQFWMRSL
ncbi:GNAT family N-acetyltransferase [Paracoccus bogoriensis]|uniref:GNAT family N-acetyltransferase n=1 Tax=Paracoccus bogoriensis TaxID=242065 RepID=UPI001C669408|nr:GNAT family N-acetyltransferase [Paracoccus bogoriensis]MBW7056196.1 GNAT family N-acetyltransferase [Paracoccus bogoriensis]